ncbi:MAG: hypothetical protein U0525_01525 [Patescibacteria group bacterium]
MYRNSSNNVAISDQIKLYINFIRPSLSPSSIRLLKIDLENYMKWIFYTNNEDNYWDKSLVDLYHKELQSLTENTNTSRKLNSINRFISWLHSEENVIYERKNELNSVNKTYGFFLSYKPILAILLIILLLSTLLYYLRSIQKDNIVKYEKKPTIRFILNIPVVSESYRNVIESEKFILKLYSAENSTSTISILRCNYSINNAFNILISSIENCMDLSSTPDITDSPKELYIDIYLRNQLINAQRVVVKTQYPQKSTINQIGSPNITTNELSKPIDTMPNNNNNVIEEYSLNTENTTSKPKINRSIPLQSLQSYNVEDGDLVTLSGNVLSKAVLNDNIYGAINNSEFVYEGVVKVKISSSSASIRSGDTLVMGIEPGEAIRASLGYDNIVGMSLEDWDNNKNKINIILATNH